jgi:hypothetical protein
MDQVIASQRSRRDESALSRSKSQVNDNFTRNLQNIARYAAEQKLKEKFGNRMQKSTSNLASYNMAARLQQDTSFEERAKTPNQ